LGTVEGTDLMRILPMLLCALALPTLAACGGDEKSTDMETGATIVAGGSGKMTLGVNSYLWHAALDTLSFMPLASADPFGGVIITDWYVAPAAPNERLKVTIYIMDRNLRADGLKVVVFRQTRNGAAWADAAATPDTAHKLEDAILTRARELRLATLNPRA
jgi:hypothetical protein